MLLFFFLAKRIGASTRDLLCLIYLRNKYFSKYFCNNLSLVFKRLYNGQQSTLAPSTRLIARSCELYSARTFKSFSNSKQANSEYCRGSYSPLAPSRPFQTTKATRQLYTSIVELRIIFLNSLASSNAIFLQIV